MNDYRHRLRHAQALIENAANIVAFSGAGMSTESGLSDFRSKGGLWERYRVVTYQEFLADPQNRVEYWTMRRALIPDLLAARPNPGHLGLARLEQRGKLHTVITQNIDGLHQTAGNTRVIELHGTNMTASCLDCGRQWLIRDIQQRLEAGDLDPHCPDCNGLIKPDTVSFGQAMPVAAMEAAYRAASECNLMLMIGSSLEVQPANLIPLTAHQAGATLLFINRTPTPYDHLATICFREGIGQVVAELAD